MNTISSKKLMRGLLLAAGFLCAGISPVMAKASPATGMIATVTTEESKIKGTVLDKAGVPVIGASIRVKNEKMGTVTDLDGRFELKVPNGAVLNISYVGFQSQEVAVGKKKELKVTLIENTKTLDEVVVVGYGTTSLRKNASAITSVNSKALKEVPYSDMATALQGRVAGVIVQQGSAEPGQGGGKISIRGNGEPLYVIDGFVSTRQRFLGLNKADIKSMTILKDAASAAVYGMNAGNGVVLITTKGGENGKLNVDYQANFGFNQLSYPVERMNAYDFAYAINNLNQALGQGINSFKNPKEMEEIANNLGKYTNWEKVCMRNSAPQNEHNLSISGGTDKLKYYGSLNYLGQGGIYSKDVLNYDRYNYRSNMSSNFDEIGLTIDLGVNGSVRDEKYPAAGAGTIYSRMRDRTPFENPYNEFGLSNQFDNPMLILDGPGYYKIRSVYNQLSGRIDWKIPGVQGLSVGLDGNYSIDSKDEQDWIETATYFDDKGNKTVDNPSNISSIHSSFANYAYDWNARIDYKRTFADKHTIGASLIHNRLYYHGNALEASSKVFNTTAVKLIQNGDASTIKAKDPQIEQASMGFVGRLNYNYANRYMIDFSSRYDGSDNFPKKSRFGFFPAVAGGWAISEESFFETVKDMNILTYLKLRGSYGQVGINIDDKEHAKYAYLSTYDYIANGYVADGKLANTVTPGPTPSVNMTWYTRDKYDMGIDFNTLNDKVEVSVDWFFEKTKGYLAAKNYKYTEPIGYKLPLEVTEAEDRTEGIDGSVKYKTKFGQVDFSAGFNFTFYNSIAFKTNEDSLTLTNPNIRKQGFKNNYVETGYVGTQFYNSPDDVLNNPKRTTSRDLRPGDLWYRDVNGDGNIDGQDQSRFGHNSKPSFVYGIDFSAGYKGINMMAVIQGTGPRQTYLSSYVMGSEGERRLDFKFQNDFWTPENQDVTLPRPGNQSLNSNNNYVKSDFWARDSYYVRLKSLTISYDLKYALLKKQTWLKNMSVFASGVNLFAFGPSVKYGDPEANNYDGYEYPMMRTYSVGFQLGF